MLATANDVTRTLQKLLDGTAVAISALCAVHCLALPILLIVFPLMGATVMADEAFHTLLLWVILPTSLIAVALARFQHRDGLVLLLVGVGLAVLLGAAVWAHDHAASWVDLAMSLTGGSILAAGHIRNFLLCRRG